MVVILRKHGKAFTRTNLTASTVTRVFIYTQITK